MILNADLIKRQHKVKLIRNAHIKTSMRRFEKEGYFKTLILEWGKAFFFPTTKKYNKVD